MLERRGNPTIKGRILIFLKEAQGEIPTCQLQDEFGPYGNFSKDINALKKAGLVKSRRKKTGSPGPKGQYWSLTEMGEGCATSLLIAHKDPVQITVGASFFNDIMEDKNRLERQLKECHERNRELIAKLGEAPAND